MNNSSRPIMDVMLFFRNFSREVTNYPLGTAPTPIRLDDGQGRALKSPQITSAFSFSGSHVAIFKKTATLIVGYL